MNNLYHPLIQHKNPVMIKSLLKYGADPNIQDGFGYTALMEHKDPVIVKLLLEFGANPDLKNTYDNCALFMYKDPVIIRLLLEHGANPNIKRRGVTLLMHKRDPEIVRLLIEFSADPNIINRGDTAITCNNVDEHVLLKYGANPFVGIVQCSRLYISEYKRKISVLNMCKYKYIIIVILQSKIERLNKNSSIKLLPIELIRLLNEF